MTSTVKVTVHCAEDREVVFLVSDGGEYTVLQNGESCERYVYDNRVATVFERIKKTTTKNQEVPV